MPNINTDIAAAAGKRGPAGLTNPALYNGAILWVLATVVLTSSTAANDTITLTHDLPVGGTVLPDLCAAICHADPGTALVMNVGDAADADRYANALNLNSGGVVAFTAANIPAGITAPLKLTTPTPIVATITTATSVTNNSKITFRIAVLVQA